MGEGGGTGWGGVEGWGENADNCILIIFKKQIKHCYFNTAYQTFATHY